MADVIQYGAINRPGIGVELNIGSASIVGAGLGMAAFVGIFERGDTGNYILARDSKELARKTGGDYWDPVAGAFRSYQPDAALGYFTASKETGGLLLRRLVGAKATKGSVTFPSARPVATGGGNALTLRARNVGAWSGRYATATLTGGITLVAATALTIGAAAYAVNQWVGAVVTDVTTGDSYTVISNTATVLTFASNTDLVADGVVAGDTVTMRLEHNDKHLAFKLSPGRVDEVNEFALDVYVNGALVRTYDRATLDPTSSYYVVSLLRDDEQNHYCEAVDEWAAASKTWAADANPVNVRSVSTALAATVLTDAAATFPTEATHGYSLAGGELVPDRTDRDARVRILSNTGTTITVSDTADLTALAAHPTDYEVIAPLRSAGGIDDNSGITVGQWVDALTAGVTPFDRAEGLGFGLVKLGIPGLSAFAAADRYAVNNAGLAYATARGWQWRVEVPAYLSASLTGKDLDDLAAVRDFLFGTASNQIALDSIFAKIDVISWQRVRYVEHGNALVVVPTMGDLLGIEARQANTTGGYVDPGAGYTQGPASRFAMPRAVEIDFDFEAASMSTAQERYNKRGMNFITRIDGRFYPWGARTAQRSRPLFTFSTHIEQLLHYTQTFLDSRALLEAVLRPQTQELWAVVKSQLTDYLYGEYAKGRLGRPGQKFSEAVTIRLDAETNPPASQAQGDMVAEVEVTLPEIAERVKISLSKSSATLSAAA